MGYSEKGKGKMGLEWYIWSKRKLWGGICRGGMSEERRRRLLAKFITASVILFSVPLSSFLKLPRGRLWDRFALNGLFGDPLFGGGEGRG